MNPTFTLQSIRDAGPCGIKRGEKGGWNKLLIGLGYSPGNYPKTALVSLGDVADINDAADSLWCIRCLDWSDAAVCRAVIAGAVMPAVKRAAKFTKDQRVHACIAAIDKWLGGDDTVDLITAARAARAAGAAGAAAETGVAAVAAAVAAGAAGAAEREQLRADIIAAFPRLGGPLAQKAR